jgi:hypothetical protein
MSLVGSNINGLSILEITSERTKDRLIVYICRCFCGKIFKSNSKDLKRGRVRSCGCSRIKNLKNKKFGRLSVLFKTEEKRNGNIVWRCLCECGNTVDVRGGALTSASTVSCGCYLREKNAELCRTRSGKNHYNWNPNLSDKDRERRRNAVFSKSIMKRDKFTCNICKKVGGNLVAHHMNSYHYDIDGRFAEENCITLCKLCHKNFHKEYGYKNNTKDQYIEYRNKNE